MADNLTVTQGSGTTVASDDESSIHYPIARPHCRLDQIVSGNASNIDGSSFSVIAAQGAGVKTAVVSVSITNTSSALIYCEIKDGSTVKWTLPVPPGGVVWNPPVPLVGTANTAWNCDPSAAATTVICSMLGFTTV